MLLHLVTAGCLVAAGLVAASIAGWTPWATGGTIGAGGKALSSPNGFDSRGSQPAAPDTTPTPASTTTEAEHRLDPARWAWTARRFQGPLFDPPPAVQPPAPPPTPPPLVLRGTVAEGEQSRAFVASRDGTAHVLRVGDELDGAELAAVAADHAVFRFQGVEHRLELTP